MGILLVSMFPTAAISMQGSCAQMKAASSRSRYPGAQSTFATAVSDSVVVGYYIGNGGIHGFVATPQ